MARFQTKVADLLDAELAELPSYASASWRALGDKIGVVGATLKRWYDARVGSENYIDVLDPDVLYRISSYFSVDPGDVVVLVTDSGESYPLLRQESAIAFAS